MTTPVKDESFGQAAIRLGHTTDSRVSECVVVQAKMRAMGVDEQLGQIMVKKGYLTPPQLQAVLKEIGVHTNPIPGYTILSRIGKGGMGTVYKATQSSVNRTVAVKILSPAIVKDPQFVARFVKEAQATARLSHKNLIAAIDAGEATGIYYFVMEYINGKSCRELVNVEGPFDEKKILGIAVQMADVLDHIHQHKMVHRDIKPENILIAPDGTMKLCDLGLAKSTSPDEQSLTQTGSAIGTPFYMSPEQVRCTPHIDIRSDLYSLGATLFYLATGHHPYEGRSAAETMSMHLKNPVPDPRKLAPRLGEGMARVIQKLMAKDPANRYATPAELMGDLRNVRTGVTSVYVRNSRTMPAFDVPVARPAEEDREMKGWLIAAAVGVLVLLAGSVVYVFSPGGGDPKPGPAVAAPPREPAAPAPAASAPVDDPKSLIEANRRYAESEQFMKQEKWKEAQDELQKLQADHGALVFTKERAGEIGRRIGVCAGKVREAEIARQGRLEAAQAAMREARWKEAHRLFTELLKDGRPDVQAQLDHCLREVKAGEFLAEVAAAHDAKRWKETEEKRIEFGRLYDGTQTAQTNGPALQRYAVRAAAELATTALFAEARVAAAGGRWGDLRETLSKIAVREETDASRAGAAEIKEFQAKLGAAEMKDLEDAAARAWVEALQRYGDHLQQKKHDAAIEALRVFERDHAPTKVAEARRAEIEAKVADATKRRAKDREDEAARLWSSGQKQIRAREYEGAMQSLTRLLDEFADSTAVKQNERAIRQNKAACAEKLGLGDNVLMSLDFEDLPGEWAAAGENPPVVTLTEEAHQGKRAGKLAFPRGGGVAFHPIKPLGATAETVTFWARTTKRGQLVTIYFVMGLGDESAFAVPIPKIGNDWKPYAVRLADLKCLDEKSPDRKFERESVRSVGFLLADDVRSVELLVDTLRVEAARK